jgi:hypothetical protein
MVCVRYTIGGPGSFVTNHVRAAITIHTFVFAFHGHLWPSLMAESCHVFVHWSSSSQHVLVTVWPGRTSMTMLDLSGIMSKTVRSAVAAFFGGDVVGERKIGEA